MRRLRKAWAKRAPHAAWRQLSAEHLSSSDPPLERSYQEWHRAVYQRDMRMGLLVSTFLYFLVSVTFAAWSRVHSDSMSKTFELALEVTMGVTFSLMFAVSFTEAVGRRPQLFASTVLLMTISFVVARSTVLQGFAVFSTATVLIHLR